MSLTRREFLQLPATLLAVDTEDDEHLRLQTQINIVGRQVFDVHAPVIKTLADEYVERNKPINPNESERSA